MLFTRLSNVILLCCLLAGISNCKRHRDNPAKLDSELLQAAKKGDCSSILELLQKGAQINAKTEGGETAVELAADYGHLEAVKLLLKQGADPVAGGLNGDDALKEAVRMGYAIKVLVILEHTTNPRVDNETLFNMGQEGVRVLLIAPSEVTPVPTVQNQDMPAIDYGSTLEVLIKHGANIEARDEENATPLMRAAELGQTQVVHALLEKGANVNANDRDGNTALMLAACECAVVDMPETLESMKLLVEKRADVNARNNAGKTALMWAAFAGRSENMPILLDNGARVDARDQRGNTALLISAGSGPYIGSGAVDTVEPVKLLLARGADLKARNKNGETALMLASSNGGLEDAKTVQLLLDKGVEVRATDNSGHTALDLAIKKRRTEVVALLRKAMAARTKKS